MAILAGTVFLISCKTNPGNGNQAGEHASRKSVSSDLGMAVLWYQNAAEARALYYQAYNLAQERLDEAIAHRQAGEKLAVVVDIDETILDNSPMEADLVKTGKGFSPERWEQWVSLSKARALPGAQPFLRSAVSNNVEVFYVSNRTTNEFDWTAKNLMAQGFPTVDAEHLLLQSSHEGKEPNRQKIRGKCKIVLLMGDNLGDFTNIFDKISSDERSQLADDNREKFGRLFIVLPNPMYGTWETSLYPPGQTDEQKAALRHKLLKSYR